MTITIERLGHRGDGIARGPIFVPLTLPGEVVEGDVKGDRLENMRIVTPSADRVSAPCSHFKSCGGCSLQHGSDEFIAAWKSGIVKASLAAHDIDIDVGQVHTSPPQSRRRATLHSRRTKKGAIVGFHARASDTVIEVPNCKLLDPDLMAAIPALQDLTATVGSRKGELALNVTKSLVGLDVSITGGRELDDQLRVTLAGLVEKHRFARLTWDGDMLAQREPPLQQMGAARVLPPPGAFLQATEHGQNSLVDAVKRAVGDADRIVDLFAGCGTFALPLASNAEVLAVEDDAAMLAALDRGWREAKGLKKVTTQTRDLFRRPLMEDEFKKYDAVVIDPPRAGAEAQVNELIKSNISRIAFVACNPVTFGRDANILIKGGYRLEWIEVVDQFRWSPHIEIAACFVR